MIREDKTCLLKNRQLVVAQIIVTNISCRGVEKNDKM